MSDIEDLRMAVGAAALLHKYLTAHPNRWELGIQNAAYQIWNTLEADLTRREKEVRDER